MATRTRTAQPGCRVGLMIGLCLHAFLEGMPLGGVDAGHSHHGHEHSHGHGVEPLLLGIVLHKYPVAMVFLAMLLNSGLARPRRSGCWRCSPRWRRWARC